MPAHRFDGFTKIDSGHLDGVKYDANLHIMQVRFKNGYTYAVQGITPKAHQEFMEAGSQGEHYHTHIRDRYPIHRVR